MDDLQRISESPSLLQDALAAVQKRASVDLSRYRTIEIASGTQAVVYRLMSATEQPEFGVRLIVRPLEHMMRVAAIWEELDDLAPRHIATAILRGSPQHGQVVVQLMSWARGDPGLATSASFSASGVARMHRMMTRSAVELDKHLKLSTELQRQPSVFAQAEDVWAAPLSRWDHLVREPSRHQIIHGDLHSHNILHCQDSMQFIDFDKAMRGPREFDLAKLIATSLFVEDQAGRVIFRDGYLREFVEFYRRRMSVDRRALAGAIVRVNAALHEQSVMSSNFARRRFREAIAQWLTTESGTRRLSQALGITVRGDEH